MPRRSAEEDRIQPQRHRIYSHHAGIGVRLSEPLNGDAEQGGEKRPRRHQPRDRADFRRGAPVVARKGGGGRGLRGAGGRLPPESPVRGDVGETRRGSKLRVR